MGLPNRSIPLWGGGNDDGNVNYDVVLHDSVPKPVVPWYLYLGEIIKNIDFNGQLVNKFNENGTGGRFFFSKPLIATVP